MPVSGQLGHRVDHVLEGLGSGQRTVLGEVADQDGGQRSGLRLGHQALGRRSDLAYRSRRTTLGNQMHGLDGIHDEQVGSKLIEVRDNGLDRGVVGQP